ncbi:hypothetical protein [Spirilliplanes yamanashiensis]|uniref:Uncharacterized protein n=1 Tax=Spirilliplanes yamanashiensis TaxID=42233 RepID=A0A8J3YD58_9ACTN|nr:hypothetical protein [Spirilliplanes yamanashiensis]MDP9819106.1 hypothetical protein [Spirilliplanes yamanashiensis]GIJ05560.1 hypothetical protein Sya03_49120 [Spirilliplanes yamanashiensis]
MAPPQAAEIDEARELFDRAVAEVRAGVGLVVDNFTRLVDNLNDHRWLVAAGGLLTVAGWEWAKGKIDELRAGVVELLDKAQYALDHSTPIISLILTSFDWVSGVYGPASDIAGRVPVKADHLLYWKGEAADAYAAKLSAQAAAAGDVAAKADAVSTWLFTVVKANVEYLVTMGGYISILAGDLAAAAIDAASVAGFLEAIGKCGSMLGRVIEKGLNDLMNLSKRLVDQLKNVRDIEAMVTGKEKMPGGHWPQAVGAL